MDDLKTTSFSQLGLSENILHGVEALGFSEPTPVQAAAIPLVLAGRDVVASAQTGTGKTAAFTLPALQRISELAAHTAAQPTENDSAKLTEGGEVAPKRRRRRKKKKPIALVITPTRELASQIETVATTVCKSTGQRAVIVMGGAKFGPQLKALQAGFDLLVATPGRLIDLMERNAVNLSRVKILVLDEADRMLNMGFWPSVHRIMQACPAERQNLLFSATIPPSIKSTIDAMMNDAALVEIASLGETAETVEEHLCPVTQGQKSQLLLELIRRQKPGRMLVFCRTKNRADELTAYLKRAGITVDAMHADRPQRIRERSLARFKDAKIQVLVATDVMSRGIDINGIDAVVNFDVPLDPEDYVHRIGRTGRAGAAGHAYTFVAPDEISPLREIEYFTKQLIDQFDLEEFDYDSGRIVPNPQRSTTKAMRTMFSGSRGRGPGRGPAGGRYGRHY
ncbi:MAG: DEAD/DEAH box helicase [Atopobiaceae bacterium]|nr:DEAD/DEAH box helicase [Atopobiaceae bacterium]